MSDEGRLGRFVRSKFREAGRRYAQTRHAYREGRGTNGQAPELADLPRDDAGRARIVCRRYAEKRATALDGDGRPACFDADHPDCQGCAEDVLDGTVETW